MASVSTLGQYMMVLIAAYIRQVPATMRLGGFGIVYVEVQQHFLIIQLPAASCQSVGG